MEKQKNAVGRRKEAVTRVFLSKGDGEVIINDKDYKQYFTLVYLQNQVELPLKTVELADKYDVKINATGGGIKGQAEAAKLGIARALLEVNAESARLSKPRPAAPRPKVSRTEKTWSEKSQKELSVQQTLTTPCGSRRNTLQQPPHLTYQIQKMENNTSLQQQLLEAGVHFGHLRKKWNPKMLPYIFAEKKGIHIIDLNKTTEALQEAASALKQIAKSGKKVMFVGTKKQAKEINTECAVKVNMPFVTERWLGGMLTNFNTVRKSVKQMQSIKKC